MLKTILQLADGTQIHSGAEQQNAVRSIKLTEQVNDTDELKLGSVCSNLLEAELQTPNGGLEFPAGEEITVYREDENGIRYLLGQFVMEKPVRASANVTRITAYDRVSLLDKDLTQWLAGLDEWPYALFDLAQMVCDACGLRLKNSGIPNGDYQVQAFRAQKITGRVLMQWIAEAAGRFCRATPDGQMELAWYAPSGITLTADGEHFYYQDGLQSEDYVVAPIEKVQIKQSKDDVGALWPNEMGEKNTYVISGNFLLTSDNTQVLIPVAQTLYAQLKDVAYTPCKVQIPASMEIHAGDTVQITDKNEKSFTAYVMKKTQTGQRDVLECTGSCRRDSSSAVNNEKYRATSQKMLEIQKDADGLLIAANQFQEALRQTEEEVAGNQKEIQSLQSSVGTVNVKADSVMASVSNLEEVLGGTNRAVSQTREQIASVLLHSNRLEIKIEDIVNDGTKKVSNTTGTFDESGLAIDRTDSPTKTQVTPDGMTVYKKSYNGQSVVLSATSDGVDAVNLHANTYLIVGENSRFENYGNGRTGCFWIGG